MDTQPQTDVSGLTHEIIEHMTIYQTFVSTKGPTQLDHYMQHHSPESILFFVNCPGKTFGEKYMEQLARVHFQFDPRIDSGHDHTKLTKKIEQKSARYHANGGDFKWQHIEIKHDFDYLLLTGLDYTMIRNYIASRQIVEELIQIGIIQGQGKKNSEGIAEAQQGYWFSRSDFANNNMNFEDYFTEIFCEQDMIQYIQQTS